MATTKQDAAASAVSKREATAAAAAKAAKPHKAETAEPKAWHGLQCWDAIKVTDEELERFGQAGCVVGVTADDPDHVDVQFDLAEPESPEVVPVASLEKLN